MKIIQGEINQINQIDHLEQTIAVIGNFDGLHTYHQKLLRQAETIAQKDNLTFLLITFDQSFEDFFRGTDSKIFSNQEKKALVKENFQVDYYFELTVGNTLMSYDPLMFMHWLKDVAHVQKLVEGSDFTFGTDKMGTVTDLQEFFGPENVVVFPRKARKISSSKLRHYLQTGQVKKANKHLLKPVKKS